MNSIGYLRIIGWWVFGQIAWGVGFGIIGQFGKMSTLAGFIIATLCITIACAITYRSLNTGKLTKTDALGIGIALLAALYIGLFAHDMPRGRDNMVHIASAIKLTESGSFAFEDVLTHPFHGFREIGENIFTSQFLPGYITYLALFYEWFGIAGVWWANSLLVFITLWSIYEIGKRVMPVKLAYLPMLIFATSYVFVWFSRHTFSENLFLALFWFGVMHVIVWIAATTSPKKPSVHLLGQGVLAISLTFLVRAEAIAFVAIAILTTWLVLLSIKKHGKKEFIIHVGYTLLAFLPAVAIFLYTTKFGGNYIQTAFRVAGDIYKNPAIAIPGIVLAATLFGVHKLGAERQQHVKRLAIVVGILTVIIGEIAYLLLIQGEQFTTWTPFKFQFTFETLSAYGITLLMAIAIIGWYKHRLSKSALIMIALALPSFIFLLSPGIAVDQPWFMRRFFPVFIPLMSILAAYMISKMHPRRTSIALLLILVFQITLSFPLIAHQEHRGVNTSLTEFAQRFTENDLIIMEPGWHWQQWAYALHYEHGLHILPKLSGITNDQLIQLISQHDRVFIIQDGTGNKQPIYAQSQLEQIDPWIIPAYPKLQPTVWLATYVEEHKDNIDLKRFRQEQQGTPPREIRIVREQYTVWHVTNKNEVQLQ
jgi:hypothetical protein